ncbi:E3 ubiquitin-protein ligase TRIM56-like [Babylonia areolata]|uniref:E3 ubiquitin-protein ligase TRIM56-like n=1 Tax=Babylonia areolata TaxID=304850 RepID=UPI003FD4509A
MASSDYECPVCHDDYVDPKVLPCGHLVCQRCVLSWLGAGRHQATCPLCRASILSSGALGPADFVAEVNALPTDLHTAALVESHRVLRRPHTCGLCESVYCEIMSYCVQCAVKLCPNCQKGHRKMSATKNHSLENLNQVNVVKLARSCERVMCRTHPDSLAELYCPAHEEAICSACDTARHSLCAGKKTVAEMAADTRCELNMRVQNLRMKESLLLKRSKKAKEHFSSMRKVAQDRMDDLQKALDAQRQKLNALIQAEEDSCMKGLGLAATEKTRAALTQNAAVVKRVAQSASEAALLQMRQPLRDRLDHLDSLDHGALELNFDFFLSGTDPERLKMDIAKLGFVSRRRGRELANSILNVGDRVKRGQDWDYGNQDGDPPGQGTVTHTSGDTVRVKWDGGHHAWYRMGAFGRYELQLCAAD